MADSRAERLALNESAFRAANERMAGWEERRRDGSLDDYYCECSRIRCRVKLRLSPSEYETVRRDSAQFVVMPGHADPSVETIVEHADRYDIVKKNEDVRELVERTDLRR